MTALSCLAHTPEWHIARHHVVTSTEVPAIMDALPASWKKGRQGVLAAKREPLPDDSFVPNRYMVWGSEAEEGNGQIFTRLSGAQTQLLNLFCILPVFKIGASIDGFIHAPSAYSDALLGLTSDEEQMSEFLDELGSQKGMGLLELKQSNGWKKNVEKWTEGVPEHYLLQVQTQMLVTGLDWTAVVARLGESDMRCHIVQADVYTQGIITATVKDFWKEVAE